MADERAPKRSKDPAIPRIQCRRLHRKLTIEDHMRCPYCYGCSADIAWGEHSHFCDFRPGIDPINFGFPESYGQHLGI